MPAFCSTETLVKNDYKKSKKQDAVWGGSAVLVRLLYGNVRSGHVVQNRTHKSCQDLATVETLFSLAELKRITTLQCPD